MIAYFSGKYNGVERGKSFAAVGVTMMCEKRGIR
jgi:hypothetical protein